MAGVMMEGDEGKTAETQGVPRIGGDVAAKSSPSGGSTTPVAASTHLTDGPRAEGVAYGETSGMNVTTRAYPAGTQMSDSTPGDKVN